jgi:2-amino-4-hydroxy-6-hydroxymethyldihydropteridine diphosphokinase
VIKQDTSENLAKNIYLGIGSNIGNKKRYIEQAKFKLQNYNIKILKSSSYYESKSWPNPKNPKFINIVVKVKTKLSPIKLLKICHLIEISLGRKRYKKNSPRTCDIDIIDYDQKTLINKKEKLILPHSKMTQRNFVLLPLFEIEKSWKHPKSKINIVELIGSLEIIDLRSIKQI